MTGPFCSSSLEPKGKVSICISTHLLAASMSQHTPMLEDEQGLCDPGLLLGALLWLAPLQGLDLHLPVDASKAASLLQHCLHKDRKGLRFSAIAMGAYRGSSPELTLSAGRLDCQCPWDGVE